MEITKEEFQSYEDVRVSGITNMFMVTTVCQLSGLEKEQVMADLKQEQFMRNLSERKKDVNLQQKLTEMGLSNLPTGSDIFLQSFMGGAGIGFDYFSKNKESQNQYKGLMDLLNNPGGNSPFGNFGVDSPMDNQFKNYG